MVEVKNVEPVVVETPVYYVDKKVKGILYRREVSGEWGWYRSGDEKKNGRYVGEMINGVPNGQGTFNNRWGGKYVGKWKDGKQNGQGTYIYHDGRKYEGEWKNGREWNGTGYNKNGEIVVRFINGKQIEQ